MKNLVHQIFYSPETHGLLDPGFIALDNSGQRPDWFEYWPIRNFLLDGPLDDDARYGFLSPRFSQKTFLRSERVMEFLQGTPDDVDVVTFSPFFDHAALFLNVFDQMKMLHPGSDAVIAGVLDRVAPGVATDGLIMSSVNTIFCNYFIAKPAFWRYWLERCEIVFRAAEENRDELGRLLNADIKYDSKTGPAKIFLIERMASLILATEPRWKVRNHSSLTPPLISLNSPVADYLPDLVAMDALKFTAHTTGHMEYLIAYYQMRGKLLEQLSQRQQEPAQP